MRHLLRRRAELKEDIEDLKEVVKSRVDGGEFLILQWEGKVNLKSPKRQRQQMLEQSQGEEDGDEDDDMHDSNHKKNNGAPHGNSGPNLSKKRKVADLKLGDTTKLKGGKLHGKGIRETSHTTDFRKPSPWPGSSGVDELDVLREPPSNYHHQFIAQQQKAHDYSHLQSSGFSSDFMGHPFTPEPRSQQARGNPTRPLLAVFMCLSFAVGSGYNYHQTRRSSYNDQETWESPNQSHSPDGCARPSTPSSIPKGFTTHRNANPGRSNRLLNAAQTMPHTSMSQAGLNAMSIASIICTLMFILKPEFILNFFTPGRLRPVKRRPKSKRPVMVSGVGNSSHDDEEDAEIEQPGYNGIMDRSAKS
ncbi:hypothetical protein Pst134EA_031744 [Puccinia striiformis f. sp. tritici]|uniref:uncharacterized protein n=1 Tax=Puccinia striiformis f. sp. tritici TaxID=168172 RepID=UPI0020080DEA|nr:uncharacterized protein Pst134EA_031744 [Puccinia striiformis f. sp. tritici]KAH9442629.1 hypothetical protein Pst134EA_031744 [Puccinia striiformis f. sp. tritici]